MNRKILFLILTGILISGALFALEQESTAFTLKISETDARFSLFANTEQGAKALFMAEDPTTSYMSILSNNRIYRLGDSFEFRQNSEITENGGKITWTSSKLLIEASIDISGQTEIPLDITISNTSEVKLDVGLRFFLDTYLGEKSVHFQTPSGPVTHETDLTDIPSYVLSASDSGESLYLLFDSDGATVPDRIVLANWKRLDDTSWTYTINTNRNFSVIPYSINDSAVALYFNPLSLAPGESRSIRVVFSTTTQGVTAASKTSASSSREGSSAHVPLVAGARSDPAKSIASIDALLELIDKLLASDAEPSETELAELKSAVQSLKEQRSQSP